MTFALNRKLRDMQDARTRKWKDWSATKLMMKPSSPSHWTSSWIWSLFFPKQGCTYHEIVITLLQLRVKYQRLCWAQSYKGARSRTSPLHYIYLLWQIAKILPSLPLFIALQLNIFFCMLKICSMTGIIYKKSGVQPLPDFSFMPLIIPARHQKLSELSKTL